MSKAKDRERKAKKQAQKCAQQDQMNARPSVISDEHASRQRQCEVEEMNNQHQDLVKDIQSLVETLYPVTVANVRVECMKQKSTFMPVIYLKRQGTEGMLFDEILNSTEGLDTCEKAYKALIKELERKVNAGMGAYREHFDRMYGVSFGLGH